MGRLVTCVWEGRSLMIEEALELRDQRGSSTLDFQCPHCGERVRAHKAGTTGQGAHFEHRIRNPLCSMETPPSRDVNERASISPVAKVSHPARAPLTLPDDPLRVRSRPDYSAIGAFLPPSCGYQALSPTLCIGLDIAWFGGSKSNPDSQFDCVVAALVGPDPKDTFLDVQRVPLTARDPDASLTASAIGKVIDRYSSQVERIVLGIDAPLLSTQVIPQGRERAWRTSDRALSDARRRVDQFLGGSNGWHPTLQPGAPLAPRIIRLVEKLERQYGFAVWKGDDELRQRVAIEVFPSEAIWALKRLGGYADHDNAEVIRMYKKMKGVSLREELVRELVFQVLSPIGSVIGFNKGWEIIQESSLNWMLADRTWMQDGSFRGGKLLDDVIDSLLCLAVAVGYAKGESHAFFSEQNLNDGHIIGPGRFE